MHRPVGLLQFPLLVEGVFWPHHCDSICKHFIHVKAVGLHWCAFIVATPMVRERFPSLHAQFLWFHTKHSMGVLIGCVELRTIF